MAAADVAPPPQDRTTKRRPFTSWVKKLANRRNHDDSVSKRVGGSLLSSRHKKGVKNNPYPASGFIPRTSPRSSLDGALSFATSNQRPATDAGSIDSEALHEREGPVQSNRSAAPTVATKAETLHSDAGQSKAATTTTHGGAVSTDGAAGGSTFSSPNQSLRSLTTTLTTIQSTSAGNVLNQNALSGQSATSQSSSQAPIMFSHQYPVTPASPTGQASAIPRHLSEMHTSTASNALTDNASILTLASSSKRRRRSMDTDASVRALAPSSVWGGSRESLPLSVLSANIDNAHGGNPRPSLGGLASAERASLYSSQGVSTPLIASDRNSYYAGAQKKDLTDAKSLRSLSNLDARSQYDAKSITDAKSMDVSSMRGYEGSVRSGAVGHNRQDSIPGSIGGPLSARHLQTGGLSRRNSERIASDLPEDEPVEAAEQ